MCTGFCGRTLWPKVETRKPQKKERKKNYRTTKDERVKRDKRINDSWPQFNHQPHPRVLGASEKLKMEMFNCPKTRVPLLVLPGSREKLYVCFFFFFFWKAFIIEKREFETRNIRIFIHLCNQFQTSHSHILTPPPLLPTPSRISRYFYFLIRH